MMSSYRSSPDNANAGQTNQTNTSSSCNNRVENFARHGWENLMYQSYYTAPTATHGIDADPPSTGDPGNNMNAYYSYANCYGGPSDPRRHLQSHHYSHGPHDSSYSAMGHPYYSAAVDNFQQGYKLTMPVNAYGGYMNSMTNGENGNRVPERRVEDSACHQEHSSRKANADRNNNYRRNPTLTPIGDGNICGISNRFNDRRSATSLHDTFKEWSDGDDGFQRADHSKKTVISSTEEGAASSGTWALAKNGIAGSNSANSGFHEWSKETFSGAELPSLPPHISIKTTSSVDLCSSRSHHFVDTTTKPSLANVVTTTFSAYLPPSNSSQPETQVDPLLETLSLSVPSVSIQPLTGSEVVHHIRSKTDDVIRRFLPCVEFLVNCQQELRQGLHIANQQRVVTHRGKNTRPTANLTPRQFFTNYVAPLPRRFERKNDDIMAKHHLDVAKLQLDQLVLEAREAVPQGSDHVKNVFLGGMRENESWGLRKWLSKHGGAGSICNDLEEIMRTVKALKKGEETTIKLAEMVRPIASQAYDRLKKDVPQAYQEQSSAHPYLPFFHRLEACLKQMATFDPKEEDVICLSDSDDEEDAVKVLEPTERTSGVTGADAVHMKKLSCMKKGTVQNEHKRQSDDYQTLGTWGVPFLQNDSVLKKVKTNDLSHQFIGRIPEGEIEATTQTDTSEKEIICLNDSDDEDDTPTSQSATLQNELVFPLQPQLPEQSLNRNIPKQSNHDISLPQYKLLPEHENDKWRCATCTFLNEATSLKCLMCNDDDSSVDADELALFLSGGIMDDSSHPIVNNS